MKNAKSFRLPSARNVNLAASSCVASADVRLLEDCKRGEKMLITRRRREKMCDGGGEGEVGCQHTKTALEVGDQEAFLYTKVFLIMSPWNPRKQRRDGGRVRSVRI